VPVAVSYPGVYVEEIPSGVRTITGVATSITAFVGWARKGPTDAATRILSWPDFARTFGGFDSRSLLGYAVSQFFANGGQQAYIVRVVDSATAKPGTVALDGKITVTAASAGAWSSHWAIVTKQRTDDNTRFRLQVVQLNQDGTGTPVEVFENLSVSPSDSRYVVRVLANDSSLVTAQLIGTPTAPPADTAIPANGQIPATAKLSGGNDGTVLQPNTGGFESAILPNSGTGGAYLLDQVDIFNLLCVPGENTPAVIQQLEGFCYDQRRRAFLIVDAAPDDTLTKLQNGPSGITTAPTAGNAAFYFPWIQAPDPLAENRPKEVPPCGFVAGLYARTDANRGVWKAPAGTEAALTGVTGLNVVLSDADNGVLNPNAVNCLRTFQVYGTVIWGARTLLGNDQAGSEWKYVPVRRTALFIESSLYRALKWVVFEPNDEPLWAQIRLNVGAFMHDLFRQGAFQGSKPQDAYFVKCDKETTTQNDINLGIVNIVVGFAPLKPAEFVVIQIQQIAGAIQT
jgi:phage tail sheath protein FI